MDDVSSAGPVLALPQMARVEEALAPVVDLPRPEAVALARRIKEEEFERIGRHQIERINEITGTDVALQLAAVVDAVIRALSHRAMRVAEAPQDWFESCGVFAIGGYGRGEYNPCSDLDLLVCSKIDNKPDWVKKGNAELQTLMWDVKFQVGASMRSLSELRRIIKDDFVTATALLEERPLIAGESLTNDMTAALEEFRRKRARPFLAYKVQEVQDRWDKSGESPLVMEPNLKTTIGGLRDIQFLRNVAFIVFGSRNLHALRDMEGIDWDDVQELLAAGDHLLGVRSLQHFYHNRRQDVFTLADQSRCASLLGYSSSRPLGDVEQLLRRHYYLSQHVIQCVQLTRSWLRAKRYMGMRLPLIATKRKVSDHFVSMDKRVFCSDLDFWKREDLTYQIFTMARRAQKRSLRISVELQRQIRSHLFLISDADREDPRVLPIVREIFAEIGMLRPILQDLHRSGFLGHYIPEFGRATCYMQFDAYHHYTVDEHTLIAIGVLDAVARGDDPGLTHMAEIIQQTDNRFVLSMALLLHDVGKALGKGHIKRGALLSAAMSERMGLDEEESGLLHTLILHHTTLSKATRMRDIHDPDYLRSLAETLGSQDVLDLLHVMTYADVKAVGPDTLTGWQAALLEELYGALSRSMAGTAQRGSGRRMTLRQPLIEAGIDDDQAAAFLSGMRRNYQFLTRPGDILDHYYAISEVRANPSEPACRHRPGQGCHSLVVAQTDRKGLLADVVAVCTGYGLDIQGCRIWTTDDGICLLSLRVVGVREERWLEEATWNRLFTALKKAATEEGDLDEESLNERRRSMFMVDSTPKTGNHVVEVHVDNSRKGLTIIDVRTSDRVGVLGRMTRFLSNQECIIDFASVSTQGEVVVDVFYLTRDGDRLPDEDASLLGRKLEELLADD